MSATQKAYTVRLAAEYAEMLAEQAKRSGETEPAFIRALVMAHLEGQSPNAKDIGPMIAALELLNAKIETLIVRHDAITTLVEPVGTVGGCVEKMSQRLEALIREFLNLAKWLQEQTKDAATC